MDYRSKDYAKTLKSQDYSRINCTYESCPQFSRCPQLPGQGQFFGKKSVRLLLVFDAPNVDDGVYGIPAVSEEGLYFRDKWLSPFISECGGIPYLINYLVRSPLLDSKGKSRPATQSESAYCWEFFHADLMQHKPEVIVAFGGAVYEQLYKKAKNKSELPDVEIGVGKLRRNSYKIRFDDNYAPTVFVGYSPGYIHRSPASASVFEEDRNRVIHHFCPHKKSAITKPKLQIDKIDIIDTVDGALDFIDFLTRGLPRKDMFDLSFDIETENLNRVYNNKILSWQFAWKPGHAVFIPIEHPERPVFSDILDKVKLIEAMQTLLNGTPEDTRIAWIVGHNLKFDLSVIHGLYRILPRGTIPLWDTMLAMHWLNENRKAMSVLDGKPYALKTLGTEMFDFTYKSEQLAARAEGELVSLPFDELVDYGVTDAILTWNIKQQQMKDAAAQPADALPKLERFMRFYYSPATRAIAHMECNGLAVSKVQLQYLQGEDSPIWNRIMRIENDELQQAPEVLKFRLQYKKLLQGESNVAYEDDIWGDDSATELPPFNVNKKEQESAFYLDFLKLKPLALSAKTKKPTLNKAFLNHYAPQDVYLSLPEVAPYLEYYKTPIDYEEDGDPIFPKNPLQLILEYRGLSKLGNTYLESINEMVENKKGDCIEGRVRASFHLSGCDTGRLSSSSPNFQNLPSGRSPMAKEVKNLFQAEGPSKKFPDGTALIQLDYKTAEVRWAAIFANDKNLIQLFNDAHKSLIKACAPDAVMTEEEFAQTQLESDIHRRTASLMYGVEPVAVSKAQRQASKSISFGLLFGMSTETLAKNNGWTSEDAEEKVHKFFSAFPDLKRYLEGAPKRAKAQGYTETFMGRRRRLAFLFATKRFSDEALAGRLSMNAPIQGQSSDGGIIGLITFLQFLLDHNLERRWLIQNVVHDSVLVQVPMLDVEKALMTMQYYFVQGMADYIYKHFGFKLPLPIECEIEVGLKYGALTKWDGRPSTLPALIENLKKDAQELWYVKKEKTGKPIKEMDLVKWQGY